MAELADAIDLGSISKEWGFKSLYPHHLGLSWTTKGLIESFLFLYVTQPRVRGWEFESPRLLLWATQKRNRQFLNNVTVRNVKDLLPKEDAEQEPSNP